MGRLIFLIAIFFNVYSASAQLSIPLNSLNSKVELRCFHFNETDTLLYASVYSDTVNKSRLWIFYDTLALKREASEVLLEIFDREGKIQKQFFLSKSSIMPKSNSKLDVIDFLSGGYGDVDSKFLKYFRKQIHQRFSESLPIINNLFNKFSRASIRESRYTLFGSWLSALQISPKFQNYSHTNWMSIESYRERQDTMKITQKWTLLGTEYNTYHLTRTAIKNRLEYIEAVYNDYSTNFRRYEYGSDSKLKQIMDGRLINDLEEIEYIILVVPY